jgi:hypothetical protein
VGGYRTPFHQFTRRLPCLSITTLPSQGWKGALIESTRRSAGAQPHGLHRTTSSPVVVAGTRSRPMCTAERLSPPPSARNTSVTLPRRPCTGPRCTVPYDGVLSPPLNFPVAAVERSRTSTAASEGHLSWLAPGGCRARGLALRLRAARAVPSRRCAVRSGPRPPVQGSQALHSQARGIRRTQGAMGMSEERVTLMEAQLRRREAEMAVSTAALQFLLSCWCRSLDGCRRAECGTGGVTGAAHARGESTDGADD